MKMTQANIMSLKLDSNEKPHWESDDATDGLMLYIGKTAKTWYYFFRDAGGKAGRKLGNAAALTLAQARDMATDLAGRRIRGEDIRKEKRSEKLTLGEFVNKLYAPQRKPSKNILLRLKTHFEERFYSRPVDELAVKDFLLWRNERIDSGVRSATVNKDIGALKAALTWGVYQGCIGANPLEKLKRLPEGGVSDEADSKEIVRYLSDGERAKLYAALDAREQRMRDARASHNRHLEERGKEPLPPITSAFADHIKPMVAISLNSGIRRGSLFGLLWSDIDFENNVIVLRPSNVKSKKRTILPMSAETRKTLLSWREQTGGDGLAFPSPRTGGILNDVKKGFHAVLKEAGIENFRWHDMRHDYASRLVRAGVDLYKVQRLMGHSSISMTMRYAHLRPDELQEAVLKLDGPSPKNEKIIGRIRKASA